MLLGPPHACDAEGVCKQALGTQIQCWFASAAVTLGFPVGVSASSGTIPCPRAIRQVGMGAWGLAS